LLARTSIGESDGLLIALTGTDGYIDANHRKVAQLFGALAEVGDDQRLVFLVNALANIDPNSRTYEKCLTEPALKRMGQHKICILLVSDLYKMWVDFMGKRRSPEQIFESIKETEGAFRYTPP
jgi:hypothetical protein